MKVKDRVSYDEEVDVLWILSKEGAMEEFVEPIPGVHVELNEDGEVMGIEIMNASKVLEPLIEGLKARAKS